MVHLQILMDHGYYMIMTSSTQVQRPEGFKCLWWFIYKIIYTSSFSSFHCLGRYLLLVRFGSRICGLNDFTREVYSSLGYLASWVTFFTCQRADFSTQSQDRSQPSGWWLMCYFKAITSRDDTVIKEIQTLKNF